MRNLSLLELYFLPPMALARVGNSDIPLENYTWTEDQRFHGGCRTIIRPRCTFRVRADGSLEPYLPRAIQFKDREQIRPVAPFFELWADVLVDSQEHQQLPVTLNLLEKLGISLDNLLIRARAGNYKAFRRTHDPACGFTADLTIRGNDHQKHNLLAFSPYFPGREPLVYQDAPISFGHLQLIKPLNENKMEQDLSIIRVRFTPGKGESYGPTNVSVAAVSTLEPGRQMPLGSMAERVHEIVPAKNRILNPNTPWSTYRMEQGLADDPQPSDSYDGTNVGDSVSWGIVDDTCEIVIKAELTWKAKRFVASTRAFVGPPDFAPDRRPFFSMADELADRELPPVVVNDETADTTAHELHDLFTRVFETASLLNLDASRDYLIRENIRRAATGDWTHANSPDTPHIDRKGMTSADRPFARLSPNLLEDGLEDNSDDHHTNLPYTDSSKHAHAAFTSLDYLILYLKTRRDRINQIVRPPFDKFVNLPQQPQEHSDSSYRDPRVFRDTLHDMRMPPYMRDSDLNPLSLTQRQYQALMDYLDFLIAKDQQEKEAP